jgi:membrane-bound lytic murein transglycosylase
MRWQPPGEGLFTGYYEPEIRGSRTRQGRYQTPVHGMPSDLVRVDLGQFIPKLKGERVSGRVSAGTLVPYANRKQINAATKAPVLFYTDDAVALFFLQIQGSGPAWVFTDGKNRAHRLCGREWPPLHRHRPHADRGRRADTRKCFAAKPSAPGCWPIRPAPKV